MDDLLKLTYKVKIKVTLVYQKGSGKTDNNEKIQKEYKIAKSLKEYKSLIKSNFIEALDSTIEHLQMYYDYNTNQSQTISKLHQGILGEYHTIIVNNKLKIESPLLNFDCSNIIPLFLK